MNHNDNQPIISFGKEINRFDILDTDPKQSELSYSQIILASIANMKSTVNNEKIETTSKTGENLISIIVKEKRKLVE